MNARSAAHVNSVSLRGGASSAIIAFFLLATTPAHPLAAQGAPARDSARAAMDSLALRLRRAEDAIAVLQQQLGEQASSGVTTRSRMQLELTGRVVVHGFRNDHRVNNADDPQFVRADSAGVSPSALGLAIRQTSLGAVLTARDVLGGRFVGDIDVDFFGGQQPSSGGRTFPLLRLRTARGAVRWTNGEIMAGQEQPLIAGLNPVSPAAMGTPDFAAAGNLWLWLPQVRATVETNGAVRLGLQAAVLSNITGDPVGLFDTDVDPAERSSRPAFEGRVRARWGDDVATSEIGCGGHVGWLSLTASSTAETHAVACDARIALARLELRGEVYDGRGLRGLGGGGIGQNLSRTSTPLDDRGGWLQLNLEATSSLRIGAGCGVDRPSESDVPVNGRLRNQSCAGYFISRPAGPLFLGAEYRRLETKYASGSLANNHISVAVGFEF